MQPSHHTIHHKRARVFPSRCHCDDSIPCYLDAGQITDTRAGLGRKEGLAHTVGEVPPQYCQGNRRNTREDIARGTRGRRSSPIPSPLSRATRSRLGTSGPPALCSTPILSNNGRLRCRPGRYLRSSPPPPRRRQTPTQWLLTPRLVASQTWDHSPRQLRVYWEYG